MMFEVNVEVEHSLLSHVMLWVGLKPNIRVALQFAVDECVVLSRAITTAIQRHK